MDSSSQEELVKAFVACVNWMYVAQKNNLITDGMRAWFNAQPLFKELVELFEEEEVEDVTAE